MIVAAPRMFIESSACVNGEKPGLIVFHGTTHRIRKMEPT